MPNWVHNIVTFDCTKEQFDEIANFLRSNDRDGSKSVFSFNKVVPMPEELNVECGSVSTAATELYLTAVNPASPSRFGYSKMKPEEFRDIVSKLTREYLFHKPKTWLTQEEEDEILRRIDGLRPEAFLGGKSEDYKDLSKLEAAIKVGKRLVDNLMKYGATTWYEWRYANWGTKWDACDSFVSYNDKQFVFDTAWGSPNEIFEALHKRYLEIGFRVEYADEDIGNNCGIIDYLPYVETSTSLKPEEEGDEAVEFAGDVWGRGEESVFTPAMTVAEAVAKAREDGSWDDSSDILEVNVGFRNYDGKEDETQLDLYCNDKVKELERLWDSLYLEMDSCKDGILYLRARRRDLITTPDEDRLNDLFIEDELG